MTNASGESSIPSHCSRFDFPECHIAEKLWLIFSPTLLLLGVVGNILSIIVLTRKRMRKTTSSAYMTALAFTDLAVLLVGLFREWAIYLIEEDFQRISNGTCKFQIWAHYTAAGISVWILAALTTDRLVSIRWPIYAKIHCSRTLAKYVIIALFLSATALNFHTVVDLELHQLYRWSADTNSSVKYLLQCGPSTPNYTYFYNILWPVIVFVAYCLGPFCVLVVGNSFIALQLWSRRRTMRRRVNPVAIATLATIETIDVQSLTRMLFSVSIFFIVITLPLSLYLITEPYLFDMNKPHDVAVRKLYWTVVSILLYTNSSVNFILYYASGSLFRKTLKNLFKSTWTSCRNWFTKVRVNRVQPAVIETIPMHAVLTPPTETCRGEMQTCSLQVAGSSLQPQCSSPRVSNAATKLW